MKEIFCKDIKDEATRLVMMEAEQKGAKVLRETVGEVGNNAINSVILGFAKMIAEMRAAQKDTKQ